MKAFRVNRDTWHYKLNKYFLNSYGQNRYYMEDQWEPRHNNFCSYWRATMFRLVFALATVIAVGIVIFLTGLFIYENPIEVVKIVMTIIGFIAVLFGVAVTSVGVRELLDRRKRKAATVPDSLFVTRYKAYKSKICPMVEYDE